MIIVDMLGKMKPQEEIAAKSRILEQRVDAYSENVETAIEEATVVLGAINRCSIPLQRSELDVEAAERSLSAED